MKKKGTYSISVVAEMFGIHQQTIRLYEKEGLINPRRSAGNTRQFTEEDVEQLEKVIHLTHKLGINIAGVSMVIRLQKKIKSLQSQINQIFKQTDKTLTDEVKDLKNTAKETAEAIKKLKKKPSSKLLVLKDE